MPGGLDLVCRLHYLHSVSGRNPRPERWPILLHALLVYSTFNPTPGFVGAACPNCPLGSTTNSLWGQAQCTPCPAGQVTTSAGQQMCANCPAGQTTVAPGSTPCVVCPPGFACAGGTAAVRCGLHTFAAGSAQTCTPCFVGQVAKPGSSACVLPVSECPVGQYLDEGLCWDCPSNAFCLGGTANYTVCEAGTIPTGWDLDPTSNRCSLCDANSYCEGTAKRATPCPSGTWTGGLLGAVDASFCSVCTTENFAFDPLTATCGPCDAGSFLDKATGLCTVCPDGTTSTEPGGLGFVSCNIICPAGFGGRNCTICPDGTWGGGPGWPCVPLPVNTYAPGSGLSTAPSCGPFAVSPGGGTPCAACAPGLFAATGAPTCITCTPGQFLTSNSSCGVCAANRYSDGPAFPACLPCPAGSDTRTLTGSTSLAACQPCASGQFALSGQSCAACSGSAATPVGMPSCLLFSSTQGGASLSPSIRAPLDDTIGVYATVGSPTTGFSSVLSFRESTGVLLSTVDLPAGAVRASLASPADAARSLIYAVSASSPSRVYAINATSAAGILTSVAAASALTLSAAENNVTGAVFDSPTLRLYASGIAADGLTGTLVQVDVTGAAFGSTLMRLASVVLSAASTGRATRLGLLAPNPAIDTVGRFAYFATSSMSPVPNPVIIRVSLDDAASVSLAAAHLTFLDLPATDSPGGAGIAALAVHPTDGFLYALSGSSPAVLVRIDLAAFNRTSSVVLADPVTGLTDGVGVSLSFGVSAVPFPAPASPFVAVGTALPASSGAGRVVFVSIAGGAFARVGASALPTGILGAAVVSANNATDVAGNPVVYAASLSVTRAQILPVPVLACPLGSIPTPYGNGCVACPVATYAPAGSAVCVSCPAGRFGPTTGLGSCPACPLGTFSASGASVCSPCSPGSAAGTVGTASTCALCPAGSYADAFGSAQCTLCAPGFFSISLGGSASESCLESPVGAHIPAPGATEYTWCPPNTYNDVRAATSCVSCPDGFVAPRGSKAASDCVACPAGSAPDVGASGLCVPCPVNSFAAGPASPNCTACARGTTSLQVGASVCADATTRYLLQIAPAANGNASATTPLAYNPAAGALVVANSVNGSVLVQDADGVAISSADALGSASAVVFSNTGALLYVADSTTGTIFAVPASASSSSLSGGPFSAATGLLASAGDSSTLGLVGLCADDSYVFALESSASSSRVVRFEQLPNGTLASPVPIATALVGTVGIFFGASPLSIAVDPVSDAVFVGTALGTVVTFPSSGFDMASVFLDYAAVGGVDARGPVTALAVDPVGRILLAAVAPAGTVVAVSLDTGAILTTRTTGSSSIPITGLSVDAITGQWIVASADGNVTEAFPCASPSAGFLVPACRDPAAPVCAPTEIVNATGDCQACPNGLAPDAATGSVCVGAALCPSGTYFSGSGCTNCPAGTASANPGGASLSSCLACDPGSSTNGWTGAATCTACGAGSASSFPGASTCTVCPLGSAQPLAGATACVPCDPATIAPVPGLAVCEVCPPNSIPTSNSTCGPCASDLASASLTVYGARACGMLAPRREPNLAVAVVALGDDGGLGAPIGGGGGGYQYIATFAPLPGTGVGVGTTTVYRYRSDGTLTGLTTDIQQTTTWAVAPRTAFAQAVTGLVDLSTGTPVLYLGSAVLNGTARIARLVLNASTPWTGDFTASVVSIPEGFVNISTSAAAPRAGLVVFSAGTTVFGVFSANLTRVASLSLPTVNAVVATAVIGWTAFFVAPSRAFAVTTVSAVSLPDFTLLSQLNISGVTAGNIVTARAVPATGSLLLQTGNCPSLVLALDVSNPASMVLVGNTSLGACGAVNPAGTSLVTTPSGAASGGANTVIAYFVSPTAATAPTVRATVVAVNVTADGVGGLGLGIVGTSVLSGNLLSTFAVNLDAAGSRASAAFFGGSSGIVVSSQALVPGLARREIWTQTGAAPETFGISFANPLTRTAYFILHPTGVTGDTVVRIGPVRYEGGGGVGSAGTLPTPLAVGGGSSSTTLALSVGNLRGGCASSPARGLAVCSFNSGSSSALFFNISSSLLPSPIALISTLTFSPSASTVQATFVDEANGIAYFLYGSSWSSTCSIQRVSLDTFTSLGALTSFPGGGVAGSIGVVVVDDDRGFAYVAINSAPGLATAIAQINLADGNASNIRLTWISSSTNIRQLNASAAVNGLDVGLYDPARGLVLFAGTARVLVLNVSQPLNVTATKEVPIPSGFVIVSASPSSAAGEGEFAVFGARLTTGSSTQGYLLYLSLRTLTFTGVLLLPEGLSSAAALQPDLLSPNASSVLVLTPYAVAASPYPGSMLPTSVLALPAAPCPAGSVSGSGLAGDCRLCRQGTYSLLGMPCMACPSGTSTSAPGATKLSSCAACAAGTFFDTSSLLCKPCASGSSNNGSTVLFDACVPCAVGSSTNGAEGSTSCSVCPAPLIALNPGASFCAPCSPGSRYAGSPSVPCSACEPGSFQPSAGGALVPRVPGRDRLRRPWRVLVRRLRGWNLFERDQDGVRRLSGGHGKHRDGRLLQRNLRGLRGRHLCGPAGVLCVHARRPGLRHERQCDRPGRVPRRPLLRGRRGVRPPPLPRGLRARRRQRLVRLLPRLCPQPGPGHRLCAALRLLPGRPDVAVDGRDGLLGLPRQLFRGHPRLPVLHGVFRVGRFPSRLRQLHERQHVVPPGRVPRQRPLPPLPVGRCLPRRRPQLHSVPVRPPVLQRERLPARGHHLPAGQVPRQRPLPPVPARLCVPRRVVRQPHLLRPGRLPLRLGGRRRLHLRRELLPRGPVPHPPVHVRDLPERLLLPRLHLPLPFVPEHDGDPGERRPVRGGVHRRPLRPRLRPRPDPVLRERDRVPRLPPRELPAQRELHGALHVLRGQHAHAGRRGHVVVPVRARRVLPDGRRGRPLGPGHRPRRRELLRLLGRLRERLLRRSAVRGLDARAQRPLHPCPERWRRALGPRLPRLERIRPPRPRRLPRGARRRGRGRERQRERGRPAGHVLPPRLCARRGDVLRVQRHLRPRCLVPGRHRPPRRLRRRQQGPRGRHRVRHPVPPRHVPDRRARRPVRPLRGWLPHRQRDRLARDVQPLRRGQHLRRPRLQRVRALPGRVLLLRPRLDLLHALRRRRGGHRRAEQLHVLQ
jgi:hypothetical protein